MIVPALGTGHLLCPLPQMLFPQIHQSLILFLSLGKGTKRRMVWDAEMVWSLALLTVFLEIFPEISERHHSMDESMLELVIMVVVPGGGKMWVEP